MADSYSVQAVLSVKDKNFTSTMKSAVNVLSGLDSSTSKSSSSVGALGTAFAVAEKVVSAACNVIKNSVQAAVSRVDTLNQYPKIMEQMGFTSEEAEASIEKLSEGIQGLPTSLDTIVDSAQNIALISGNLDEATNVALALNDALLASGASTDEAARATEAYDKMLSTGKVTSQQWTTLEQNMKYALSEVAKQLGITSGSTQELYSAMQSGQISFDQFNEALIECDTELGGFSEMALTACDGIATSWENVKTAVVRGVANMIQSWNDAAADNSIPTIQETLQGLRGVVDTVFNAASKAITVFVNNLNTIVAACAPVVAAVAGLKVVKTVSGYFKDFKDAGSKAAEALKSYGDKAKEAETASKNLKIAEESLKNALDKEQTAYQKAIDAAGDLNNAEKKVAEATKTRDEAVKQANTSLENSGKASEAAQKAEAALKQAEQELAQAKKESVAAEEAYSAAKEVTAAATELDTAAQEANAAAVEGTTLAEIAQNAILAVLSGEMTIAAAAQEALNAAMAANPIGLVVTAIAALVSVLGTVITLFSKFTGVTENAYSAAKDMKEAVDELCDSWDEERDAQEENLKSVNNNVKANEMLCQKVTELASKESLSASETATLNGCLETLNGNVEGLDASYDSLTGSLNMSLEALQKQVDLVNAQEQCTATQEALNDSLIRQGEIEQELGEKTEALTELENLQAEAAETGAIYGVAAKQKLQAAIQELEDEEVTEAENQKELLDEVAAAQEEYTQLYNAELEERSAALQSAIDQDCLTYDMLSEENQALVDELNSTWSSYVDQVLDGNNELSDSFWDASNEEGESMEEAADRVAKAWNDTVEHNLEVINNWGDNMETLRDRMEGLGLDPAVCDQLEEMGIDGAALVAAFCSASDEELERFAQNATDAGDEVGNNLLQAMDATDIPGSVSKIAFDAGDSFSQSLRDADFASAGQSIPEGVVEGITAGEPSLLENIRTMGTDTEEELKGVWGYGSPAQAFVPAGESIPEGVAEGIQNSTAAEEAITELAENLITMMDDALAEMDFSDSFNSIFEGLAEAATTGMEQTSQAVTSGMTLVENAITSGMQTASTAMTTGFTNMGSSVSVEMSTIASVVSAGMANVSTVMTSGVQGVRSALTEGFSGMSSAVTSSMSSIQSAVSSGMSSVTSTMTSGVNSVKSALTSGFQNMATTVNTQMNKIKSTITTTMNNIKSTMTTQLNNLKTTWTNTMNNIQTTTTNGLNKVKSAFSSAMSSIRSTASSASSSIVSTFNSMYSGMYSAGCNAMSGLQAGLNARSGSVLATARSIANSVTSTINSALKVGSPSKVMKSTGKDTIQGLVNGMKAMLSDVKDMSVKIADTVSDMVFGTFDSPKLAFEGGAELSMDYYFDSVGILDALDDLKDAVIEESQKPVEITTVTELDGREIAKGTAQYMQDAQDKLQARKSRRDQFSISGG